MNRKQFYCTLRGFVLNLYDFMKVAGVLVAGDTGTVVAGVLIAGDERLEYTAMYGIAAGSSVHIEIYIHSNANGNVKQNTFRLLCESH